VKDFGIARMTRRMALRDWLALVALLLVLTLALGWQNGLGRLDQTLYDTFVGATPQPRHADIIMVAIDDYSLQQLGRWPWPRARHAALLERLTQARPRAIGLDVILTEPDSSPGRSGDIALAAAVAASTVTVLPVVISNPGTGLAVNLPVAPLASAARTLAHIDLEHDSDGVVRSVYLQETLGQQWWPHFSLALARVGAGNAADKQAPGPAVAPAPAAAPAIATTTATATWQRATPLHIPFAATGSFASVPYVAVLRGEVSPEFFRDKYVLIGATAMGLSDAYPTPVSGTTGTMPGIEIHANVLASLLDGRCCRCCWH
jgi:CHASE2 domain-containing sensor protein